MRRQHITILSRASSLPPPRTRQNKEGVVKHLIDMPDAAVGHLFGRLDAGGDDPHPPSSLAPGKN